MLNPGLSFSPNEASHASWILARCFSKVKSSGTTYTAALKLRFLRRKCIKQLEYAIF
ncbi:MAG: hypothetical protein PHE97_00745 [Candidatus Omnitrophica bacterium]|nr:hypothetical protein [Candidatus Omnitrophota bacterium]